MAELRRTIEQARSEQNRLVALIEQVEGMWLPELEALIRAVNERFSAAFARLGCAGEVHLARDDNYEKWGIDILVKFRDTERLQLLTNQRQSGGERSLSTILYLLSLTELSRTPFSLVDEINQGMDPRAERAVHDQMVAMTCQPQAGQYFLITPKLLPGLLYHELMKVLIINNGEWLPERLSCTLSEILLTHTLSLFSDGNFSEKTEAHADLIVNRGRQRERERSRPMENSPALRQELHYPWFNTARIIM